MHYSTIQQMRTWQTHKFFSFVGVSKGRIGLLAWNLCAAWWEVPSWVGNDFHLVIERYLCCLRHQTHCLIQSLNTAGRTTELVVIFKPFHPPLVQASKLHSDFPEWIQWAFDEMEGEKIYCKSSSHITNTSSQPRNIPAIAFSFYYYF